MLTGMRHQLTSTAAASLALAFALTGCSHDDTNGGDGDEASTTWTVDEVQAKLSESVAQNLSVSIDQVTVRCPEGLDTTAEEAVEMTCTAQVGNQRYPIKVRSEDGDDALLHWRHTNGANN
ncbi:MAG: hypothetical protein L0H93_18130 [Nocardioides sp.]|nr:hypothetical protein [Nocardioides sp.]